jgi:heme exporter protein A
VSHGLNPLLLELRQLSCERDERLLFSELSLTCNAGDLVQVLGPNGSGKTTLLRALAGISRDYRGIVLWRGTPVAECRWEFAHDMLFLGHLPGVKSALNPLENLRWYTAADGRSDADILQALAAVGLAAYEDTPCYQLSAGQMRRVALARLHLSQASIWILDEPFTAIDKQGVQQLEQLLQQHRANGGMIILTSHQDLQLPALKQINLPDFQPVSGVVLHD